MSTSSSCHVTGEKQVMLRPTTYHETEHARCESGEQGQWVAGD